MRTSVSLAKNQDMTESDFMRALEVKVAEQLKAQRVGFLLGAGSSYLDNTGYPLAFELWDLIKEKNYRHTGTSRHSEETRQRRYWNRRRPRPA